MKKQPGEPGQVGMTITCRFRGCVCLATVGDLCPTHSHHHDGKACAHCRGTGTSSQQDATRGGQLVPAACPICAGTGLVDKKKPTPKKEKPVPIDERPLIQLAEKPAPRDRHKRKAPPGVEEDTLANA